MLKRSPVESVIRLFFIGLIIFGIPINLLWNRAYDSSSGWTIGEWLISYAAGFVRRGLPGSLIYNLSVHFHFPTIGLVWMLSLFFYLLLLIIVSKYIRPYFKDVFLYSPCFLLAPVIGNFLIRKDVLLVLTYSLILFTYLKMARSGFGKANHFLIVNVLASVAILSHEQFGLWALPSLVILLALILARESEFSTFRCFWASIFFLLPSFIIFVLAIYFHGSSMTALTIHNSWLAIPEKLQFMNLSISPLGAIDAIGWSQLQGWQTSGISMLGAFDEWIWIPAAWIFTIFICASLFVNSVEIGYRQVAKLVVVLQLIAFIPIFVVGFDFGRWIFNWMGASCITYSFVRRILDDSTRKSHKSNDNSFLPLKIRNLATSVFLVPLNSSFYSAFMLCIAIPRCCWSMRTYFILTPPYFLLYLAKQYIRIVFSAGHIPSNLNYPIF